MLVATIVAQLLCSAPSATAEPQPQPAAEERADDAPAARLPKPGELAQRPHPRNLAMRNSGIALVAVGCTSIVVGAFGTLLGLAEAYGVSDTRGGGGPPVLLEVSFFGLIPFGLLSNAAGITLWIVGSHRVYDASPAPIEVGPVVRLSHGGMSLGLTGSF